MEGFWKPGLAPPGSDDRDEPGSEAATVVWNPHAALSLAKQRASLPVAAHRRELLFCVERNPVTIVVGATGSGKTTQIPQFLLEARFNDNRTVGVTQPRRISAISVAMRVAEEMGVRTGAEVGYNVRFDNCSSDATKILFLTDGVLMRELIVDPLLTRYSIIMIDEAHERTIHSDLLFALIKKILQVRSDLRLIVASATIDAAEFRAYFSFTNDSGKLIEPVVTSVSGRQFPVDVHYLKEACSDYVVEVVKTAQLIHRLEPPGDILCFLTGKEEIDRAVNLLNEYTSGGYDGMSMTATGLHATMPPDAQLEVFQPAPRKTRKVVVSTNIAETSVTVPGVRFVVDCGFVKIRWYNPTSGLESLTVVPTSQASANQRAGRAGRVMPGKAYRMYPERAFQRLAQKQEPEIQRSELSAIVLQLKILHVRDVVHFDFMSPPPAASMGRALEMLFSLGAIDGDNSLTPVGAMMAELPLTPQLARILIASGELGCSEEVLSIVAMLSVQDPFLAPKGKTKSVDSARRTFAVTEGDHVTLLNIFNSYMSNVRSAASWCGRFFLNQRTLARAAEVRSQIRGYLVRFGVALRSSENLDAIRKAVVSGLFCNTAQLQPDGMYKALRGGGGQALAVHPSSSLFRGTLPEWVVFGEMIMTSKPFINQLTPVSPEWLVQVAPAFFSSSAR